MLVHAPTEVGAGTTKVDALIQTRCRGGLRLKAMLDVGTPETPRPWLAPPVQASADGLSLVPTSDKLTVLGELNKLAFNVAEGRNWLGIHSRIGGNSLGMTLGEDVAIRLLEDLGFTYPEKFSGWTLTKFDGTTVTIGGSRKI